MNKKIFIENGSTVMQVGEIELNISPKELAETFKKMNADDKALFFEELHRAYRKESRDFTEEIESLTKSIHHSLNGKWMMCEIGSFKCNNI